MDHGHWNGVCVSRGNLIMETVLFHFSVPAKLSWPPKGEATLRRRRHGACNEGEVVICG